MPFTKDEITALLAVKGVGATVIQLVKGVRPLLHWNLTSRGGVNWRPILVHKEGEVQHLKLLLIAFVISCWGVGLTPHQAHADDGMAKVQLIIKKMKSNMQNMKDFDELEKAGMDKVDVERLRKATRAKIKQMTSDAVNLIRVL